MLFHTKVWYNIGLFTVQSFSCQEPISFLKNIQTDVNGCHHTICVLTHIKVNKALLFSSLLFMVLSEFMDCMANVDTILFGCCQPFSFPMSA